MRKLAVLISLIVLGFASVFGQQTATKRLSITARVNTIPAAFFGLSIFGTPTCPSNVCDPSTSFPLQDSVFPGMLGKVGFSGGFHLEPTCDGGTNPNNSCYHWSTPPGWQCGPSSTQSCTALPSNLTYMPNFATRLGYEIRWENSLLRDWQRSEYPRWLGGYLRESGLAEQYYLRRSESRRPKRHRSGAEHGFQPNDDRLFGKPDNRRHGTRVDLVAEFPSDSRPQRESREG